jgi:glycopeptide antibiotics resistance protein
MRTKQHKLIFTILIIYIALILFFLFFSFDRLDASAVDQEYRFDLIPRNVNLRFPTISDLKYFHLWFFNFGNFAGFIPFGILIPILYRCSFFRFILLFFLSILIIETVQMLTFLGSFDINDAIVNTLGAAVGFCAYKTGFRFTNNWKRIGVTLMSAVILSIAVIGFSELVNKSFTKIEGPVIALNELETNENLPLDKNLQSFIIGHEKIEPKINLYSGEGDNIEMFTYAFGGKDIVLSLKYGITDNLSDYDSKMIISADGKEVDTYFVDKEYRYPTSLSSDFNMDKVNELTITIKGNLKLWDVTFKEMKYWWE